jgi:hypothetical protein
MTALIGSTSVAAAAQGRLSAEVTRSLGDGPRRMQRSDDAPARYSVALTPRSTDGSRQAVSRITTVDARSYTGAENAIYAANRRTVFVAYKRFRRNPYGTEGDVVPAQLRVARSDDAGKSWSIDVVDAFAREQGDLIQQSVSIGGDHGDTVYVAYLVETETLEGKVLKVAKSTNAGATWTVQTVASGGVGEYNAIKVVDADTVLLVANQTDPTNALRLFTTADGGVHWDGSTVDTFGWHTGLGTARSGRIWVSYYHPGDTDLYAATSRSPTESWTGGVAAGQPADGEYTGLGSSLDVFRNGDVYVSYENFSPAEGSRLWVASSTDRGASWSTTFVDRGGWNTAIDVKTNWSVGGTDIFVSYWFARLRPRLKGRVRMAHSLDGGETWSVVTVPEPGYAQPYLDLASPTRTLQYVSYQVGETATGHSILRVARLNATE